MSKHTPGPWSVHRWSWPTEVTGPIHQVISSDNFLTAFVPAWDDPRPGEVEASEEAKANARLIAAAPELLEACKVALGIIGFGAEHDQISDAIAKATGEQP